MIIITKIVIKIVTIQRVIKVILAIMTIKVC